MTNTNKSFEDKWERNKTLAFSETLREKSDIFQWILSRNGFSGVREFKNFLKTKIRILDAGCGNGRITALLRKYSDPKLTEIIGVDFVSSDIARANMVNFSNVSFYKKDLLDDLNDLGKFDFIYCQEVLHHTLNPKEAFLNLCNNLAINGEIAIYVYMQKAPIREFVDDFVRDKISSMPYEEAIKICEDITTLGQNLSELKATVTIPDIDILEIRAGEYDIQRFIYHFFMKCFWNPDLTFHDNTVINYDWYHPQLCSRHTIDEIREWFQAANLTINHEHVDFYGITIRGMMT